MTEIKASTENTVATDHVGTSKQSIGVEMRITATDIQMAPIKTSPCL